jgi:hypothetical protein
MSCEIELSWGQDGYLCGKIADHCCAMCELPICEKHTYNCCGESFGACCIGEHKCRVAFMELTCV